MVRHPDETIEDAHANEPRRLGHEIRLQRRLVADLIRKELGVDE